MNGPWDIPTSWTWSTCGEVGKVVGGGTPRTTEPRYWIDGTVPWVTPADLSGYQSKLISRGQRMITEEGLRRSGAQLLPAGTVLISSRAPVGYAAIAACPLATNQGFKSLILRDSLLPDFFYHFVLGNRQLLLSFASGTTFPEVSGKNAARLPVPIPPLNEQHRIVAAIEEHLSDLDASVAALERVRAALPRYRAAVLKAACEGRLVEREAETVQLGTLLRDPLRNGHSAKKASNGKGVRTFTLTAATDRDFSMENTKLTVADPRRVRELWAQPGDIFVERSNTPELVGTAALYKGEPNFAVFPDLVIRVRIAEPNLPEYVEMILRSDTLKRYFAGRAQGIAGSMPKIDQTAVAEAPIPLASVGDQQRIVAEVDRRLSLADAAERVVTSGLAKAKRLRQAILKRAFEGNLVPQDPNDEPASVLLERVRAARAIERHPSRKSRGKRVTRAAE